MVAGFITWMLALTFAPGLAGDLIGMLACLATLMIVTPMSRRRDPAQPARNHLGEVVEFRDRLGVLPLFRRIGEKPD
jgi:hypothetical protein